MKLQKSILLLTAALLALAWGVPRQLRIQQGQAKLTRTETQIDYIFAGIDRAKKDLNSLKTKLAKEQQHHEDLVKNLGAPALESQTSPTLHDASPPPERLRSWNPNSSYVWLAKEDLAMLPIVPFDDQASLRPEVAAVLTLTPAQQQTVNNQLKALLQDYRAVTTKHVEVSEDHLPGIAGRPGAKKTIRVPPTPQIGGRYKHEFEEILHRELGADRAGLILQRSEGWLRSNLNLRDGEPKLYSLVHHNNGDYHLSIGTPGRTSMSVGGPIHLEDYIPTHLLPFFDDLLENP